MHRNNFDLLRLVLALTVFFHHASVITMAPQLSVLEWFPATAAVQGFFVVSGLLVWMSFERSSSLTDYVTRRARRIIPAYVVIVVIAMLAAGVLSGSPLSNLWSSGALKYLAANLSTLTFLAPSFSGAFDTNNWISVNGSLWSIKVELGCYLLVPPVAWLTRRVGWFQIMLPAYLLSVAWTLTTPREWTHQTPGLFSYFATGATLYRYRDWLSTRWRLIGPIGMCLWILCGVVPAIAPLAAPAAMAVSLTYVAVGLPYLGDAARFGDLSYGIYLVHWPILQCLYQLHAFDRPWQGAIIALISVIGSAALMWHGIERRWLQRTAISEPVTATAPLSA